MVDQSPLPNREATADRRKGPFIKGGVFNPWVNIPVSVLFTLGCGAMTIWFGGMLVESRNAPPYPDQGLDVVGTTIGTVVMILITLALVGVTIFLIVWWKRVGLDWLHKDRTGESTADEAPARHGGDVAGSEARADRRTS